MQQSQGKVGFRCTTPDYLPIVGQAVAAQAYCQQFQHIQNPRLRSKQPPAILPGLLVNVGHGSKGCSTVSSCAELIAQLIYREPIGMPMDLVEHLHPGRFLIRDIRRNQCQYL